MLKKNHFEERYIENRFNAGSDIKNDENNKGKEIMNEISNEFSNEIINSKFYNTNSFQSKICSNSRASNNINNDNDKLNLKENIPIDESTNQDKNKSSIFIIESDFENDLLKLDNEYINEINKIEHDIPKNNESFDNNKNKNNNKVKSYDDNFSILDDILNSSLMDSLTVNKSNEISEFSRNLDSITKNEMNNNSIINYETDKCTSNNIKNINTNENINKNNEFNIYKSNNNNQNNHCNNFNVINNNNNDINNPIKSSKTNKKSELYILIDDDDDNITSKSNKNVDKHNNILNDYSKRNKSSFNNKNNNTLKNNENLNEKKMNYISKDKEQDYSISIDPSIDIEKIIEKAYNGYSINLDNLDKNKTNKNPFAISDKDRNNSKNKKNIKFKDFFDDFEEDKIVFTNDDFDNIHFRSNDSIISSGDDYKKIKGKREWKENSENKNKKSSFTEKYKQNYLNENKVSSSLINNNNNKQVPISEIPFKINPNTTYFQSNNNNNNKFKTYSNNKYNTNLINNSLGSYNLNSNKNFIRPNSIKKIKSNIDEYKNSNTVNLNNYNTQKGSLINSSPDKRYKKLKSNNINIKLQNQNQNHKTSNNINNSRKQQFVSSPSSEKLIKTNSLSSLSEIKKCPFCNLEFIDNKEDINDHIYECSIKAFSTDDI